MDKIGVLIVALCMIWIVVASIIYLLIRLVKLVACRGIKECRNRKCVFNEICSKYDSRLTEEEANELYKLIDSMYEKKYRSVHLILLREAQTGFEAVTVAKSTKKQEA